MQALLQFLMFVANQVTFAQDDCGNTSFSEREGVITSPDFPLSNPQNLSCTYSIDVGRNNSVLLKFIEFDLESPLYADTCIHDFITITCNETDDENVDFRKRACGIDLVETSLWFSNCTVVKLNFFADSSVTGGGFSIEYNVIETVKLADNTLEIDCGDTMFTSSSGFIRLPSNPTEYSANVDCNYTISTNNASTFSIGILSLRLPQLLDSLPDCDSDYVMIGCVTDGEAELNPNTSKTYCRSSFDNIPVQPSRIVFSNCSMVKIAMRSSDYNYQGDSSIPFAVSAYDKDCGSTVYSGSTGTVTSPRYPLSYPHSLDCVYFFDVDRTKTTTFSFLSYNLGGLAQAPMEDHCVRTWLTVSCLSDCGSASTNSTRNRKYCTKPLLPNYSNCDCLTLNFFTNSSDTTRGFEFRYEITSPGNATSPEKHRAHISVTGPSGFITSPQFPLSYPNNVNYTYSFHVNRTEEIGLYFHTFKLEGATYSSHSYYKDNCQYDWLLITCKPGHYYNSGNKRYCGGERTTPVVLSYSYCDSLTLNFVTDAYVTDGGFKIWYTISSSGSVQSECGDSSFSGPNGFVMSPNFPLSHPSNMNCKYTIGVGLNNSVQLKIKHFSLDSRHQTCDCPTHWLMVTCNETTKSNSINGTKLCGYIRWISSLRLVDCPFLVLEFVSDRYNNMAGFMIEYTVTENSTDDNPELDCGVTRFTGSSGNISFPITTNDHFVTVNCTYTISTDPTNIVFLNLSHNAMARFVQSFQCCEGESLMIGCVSGEEAELNRSTAREYCSDRSRHLVPGQMVFTDCRTLKLSMRSTHYANSETIHISYSDFVPNDVCGSTSFSAATGVISTLVVPFSTNYPKRVNCLYTIDTGHVNSVSISVDRLIFDRLWWDRRHCDDGRLTITCSLNGTSVADRKICGLNHNSVTTSFLSCQKALINLTITSDSAFTLRYRVGDYELGCGTTMFTNSSGVISLPINPTGYPAPLECTYTISAKDLTYIYLSSDVSPSDQLLKSFQDCGREWLKFGCASEEYAELKQKTTWVLCKGDYSMSNIRLVYPDCRTVKLSIRSRAYDLQNTFRFRYLVAEPDKICGNTSFSSSNGIVSSPRLPFNYQKRVSCLYTIESGRLKSFVLSIDSMNLGNDYDRDGNCNRGWLIITCLVNGTSIPHPIARRKLCGYKPQPMTGRFPTCHSVLLNFSSDQIGNSILFTMRYTIGDYAKIQELDCGTTLFANTSGVINLPRNPSDYPATVNCTYAISTKRMSDIWIETYPLSKTISGRTLADLLMSFQDCDKENLTIGCVSEGETELSPNSKRVLCSGNGSAFSNSGNRMVFVDCPTLKLSIRSSTYDFKATFPFLFSVHGADEICGNTSFSAQTGKISSPKFPSRYPKRINCVYVIESDHINSVVLSIDHLNLGPHGGSCTSDWLTITCLVNGSSMDHPLANRMLCGNPDPVVARFAACRSVLLNFSSDYAAENTGFTIRYRIGDYDPECGNTSFSGPNGVITSPRFPLSYPHNLNCLYSITGGQRSAISLLFLSFNLAGISSWNYRPVDYCSGDWLTVSCLSDDAVVANLASNRKYCGRKTTPLTFAFPSCAVVVLNFRSDQYASQEGFKVRYTVIDADFVCGSLVYGRPSGVISVPWNYADYNAALNCSYVINATKPSSISLTVWSISLQGLVKGNCQLDWLLISCIDGRRAVNFNIPHTSCDYLNSSIHLTFPGCTVAQIIFHRNAETTGRTFHIEYTVTGYGDNVPTTTSISTTEPTTELPTTSVVTTDPAGTDRSCAAGCKLSSDSTNCDCLPEHTRQSSAAAVSTENPVTRSASCDVGCKLRADGTTCDCSTTYSGDVVVNIQMGVSAQRGHTVVISLAVVLVVIGVICVGAFLLFRRHQKKKHSVALMQANEEDRTQMELEADPKNSGSLFGGHGSQDRDTPKYLPLRPVSTIDNEEPSTISNTTEILDDIQLGN